MNFIIVLYKTGFYILMTFVDRIYIKDTSHTVVLYTTFKQFQENCNKLVKITSNQEEELILLKKESKISTIIIRYHIRWTEIKKR